MSNLRKDLLQKVLNSSCVEELLIFYDLHQGSDWNYLEFFSVLEYLLGGWLEYHRGNQENYHFFYGKMVLFLESLEKTEDFNNIILSDTFLAFISTKLYSTLPKEIYRVTQRGNNKTYLDFLTYEKYQLGKFFESLKNKADIGK